MKKLIFIYNANHGMFAGISGAVTKVLAPKNQDCNLCQATHGVISIKNDWKDYLDSLPNEKIFLHKDELDGEYEKLKNYPLPVILSEENNQIEVLVSKEELDNIKESQQLIKLLSSKL